MTKRDRQTSAVLAVLPLVLVVAGIFLWYATKPTTSHPVASASSGGEAHVEVAEDPLEVTEASVDDAATEEELAAATGPEYRTNVEKPGDTAREKRVTVSGKPKPVEATLVAATATLRVDANVPGAKVFLDGVERGTAPVEISNIPPGPHQIEVSAEGYVSRTEALEVGTGRRDLRIDLVAPPPKAVNESVAVKHKHRIGSCEGELRASADGLEYDSSHKDAFSIALSEVERFSVEKGTLTVKIRDGRNYNFEERTGNPPALARFHESVTPSLETSK